MYVSSGQVEVIAQFLCERFSIQALVHRCLNSQSIYLVIMDIVYLVIHDGYSLSRGRCTLRVWNIGFSDWAAVVENVLILKFLI